MSMLPTQPSRYSSPPGRSMTTNSTKPRLAERKNAVNSSHHIDSSRLTTKPTTTNQPP
ncbi:hypothetical protein B0T18DRAFT_397932 [Schizothecium vesticola]|uniref:Uncharacterized protein n=1 Tax=Schizothecium vesticola TaxID=314040 RepID=A0AA40F9R8_9PEZI|nr:hypothetical protein B0T18DRAFT_397932 [Schizothecium vesticola]